MDDINTLLEDLKDFYVWKEYKNNPNFINEYKNNREETLKNVIRPMMSK